MIINSNTREDYAAVNNSMTIIGASFEVRLQITHVV